MSGKAMGDVTLRRMGTAYVQDVDALPFMRVWKVSEVNKV